MSQERNVKTKSWPFLLVHCLWRQHSVSGFSQCL